jgi:hypothetical protein
MGSRRSLIYGVGINDAGYVVQINTSEKKLLWICPFFSIWKGMIQRCYSEKFQDKHPTYRGVLVAEEWHTFSVFKTWMEAQSWEGKDLDKDILGTGQIYSPDHCVFVHTRINRFLTHRKSKSSTLPTGVHEKKGRYVAQSNDIDGKRTHLGYFTTPEAAHTAWLDARIKTSKQLLQFINCERLASAFLLKVENKALTPEVKGEKK